MEFIEVLREIQSFIPPEYAGVSRAITAALPWIVLAMALLLCFCGHKVHQLWAEFLFFGVGFLLGIVTGAFLQAALPDLNLWVSLLPPLVLGVLGALFAKRLHKLQLFLVNATLVYAALPAILGRWLPDTAAILLGLAAAVAVGLLAAKYKYIVTILTTGFTGAVTAAPMILELVKANSLPLLLTLEGLLFAGGLAVQILTEKRGKGEEKAKVKGAVEETAEHR